MSDKIRSSREYQHHVAMKYTQAQLDTAVQEAITAEREACAQIADRFVKMAFSINEAEIAQMIRARVNHP